MKYFVLKLISISLSLSKINNFFFFFRQLDIKDCEDDDKDDLHATPTFVPPTNYIKISQGKIQLVHQQQQQQPTPTTPTSVQFNTGLRAQSPTISAPYSTPLTPLLNNGVVMESSKEKVRVNTYVLCIP